MVKFTCCPRLFAAMLLALCGLADHVTYAQYTSPCGGSSTNRCSCHQRYVCDRTGYCACSYDKYCADTNCGYRPNSRNWDDYLEKAKESQLRVDLKSAPMDTAVVRFIDFPQQINLAQGNACPTGYKVFQNNQAGLFCISATSPKSVCPGKTFHYTCGPQAASCCGINQDNPCMAGWYACSPPGGSGFGSGAAHCCPR